MSARPGPRGGYRVSGIPTAIAQPVPTLFPTEQGLPCSSFYYQDSDPGARNSQRIRISDFGFSSLLAMENRFVGTQAAAEYSGIPAGTLRAWRCQGVGPRFYKPRGRALYDIADLDEFIRSGIRVSSVRASKEERNVYLPTG